MKPRIRSLKPEMWADERIVALSRDARLLLLGMVTMADDEGRFRARRTQLLGHIFPGDEDALDLVDGWIAEVQAQGIVVFYLVDGTPYGAFRHWRRHQKINRPSPSTMPPPPDPKVVRENRVPTHGASTKRSVEPHGTLSELTGSTHSKAEGATRSDPILIRSLLQDGSKPTESQRVLLLSALLAAHICANDPKADPDPESERWQIDMRLLLADRGDDWREVMQVIDWCQADTFWRGNILSPGKLRKQFTQLRLKATKPSTLTNGVSELDRKRLASMNRLINERGAA